MQTVSPLTRIAGVLLAAGGAIFFVGGALHPHSMSGSLRPSVVAMLSSHLWASAHWLAFVSDVLVILAIWLLQDDGWAGESIVAQVGTRLTIVGGIFMMVEFAVELAAQGAIGPLNTGQAAPMFNLFAVAHAAGWPTIGAGFILVILGVRVAVPLPVRILGVVGALAMGLAGILVAGFFLTSFGWLFIGGELLGVWIVWAGIQTARVATPAASPSPRARLLP